jgi:hypothetical protein
MKFGITNGRISVLNAFLLVKVLIQNDRYYDNPHYEYSSDGISINFTTRVYQYSTVLENKVGISENLPDLTIQDFITSLKNV